PGRRADPPRPRPRGDVLAERDGPLRLGRPRRRPGRSGSGAGRRIRHHGRAGRRRRPGPHRRPRERGAAHSHRVTVGSPDFAVLGRQFHCHVETSAVLAWLDRHWRRDEHAAPPHGYAVELVEEAGRVDAAVGAPGAAGDAESASLLAGDDGSGLVAGWEPEVVRLPDGITLSWARRANEWVWRGGEAYVHLRLGDDGARVRFRFGADIFPALYAAVTEALRASGLLPLHAAVVVSDGVATALAAPSGTGKTTTLLRLLSRGWSPLAEDLSWLDPGTGTLYGWDRGLRLWSDGLARVGPE